MAEIIARTIQLAHSRNNIQAEIVRQDSEVKVSVSRAPSTANLFVDSNDRQADAEGFKLQPATDFTIQKNNNILTGYFTRLAVVEIVLDWCIPNVSPFFNNNNFAVIIGETQYAVQVPTGHYNIAQALTILVALLNTAVGSTFFSIAYNSAIGDVYLDGTGDFTINTNDQFDNLSAELGFTDTAVGSARKQIVCPKLLPTGYIDFLCNQLTYPQDVKDGSTALLENNVIYRWYLAWEQEPSKDAYGFPIFQGYTPFLARRYLAFPKQIKWDANLPIGQLNFQVVDDKGMIIPTYESVPAGVGELEFNMTLLVSEN
jgi:hypothetical protein